MATRVLSMSARLGPVPQPPAPQDEPVFAQLKLVLGAANPARDAALSPGEELKHTHHRPQNLTPHAHPYAAEQIAYLKLAIHESNLPTTLPVNSQNMQPVRYSIEGVTRFGKRHHYCDYPGLAKSL
uniref:Uncharacterized protein n=1 Tax=Pan troglodytes TaxID=9598 RepID=A0A2I3RZY6_PANTR